jgi:thiol-disulfide isomerase/thioredoxin
LAVTLFFLVVGCGESGQSPMQTPAERSPVPPAPSVGSDQPTQVGPTRSEPTGDAGAANGAVAEPPGKLELPADFNPNALPQTEPVSQGGGYELPDLGDQSKWGAPAAEDVSGGAVVLVSARADSDEKGDSDSNAVEITLKAATWDQIRGIVTKTGRVTVVDVWSLACEPCLKEFPGLVALHRDLGDSVACFAVDADFDGRRTKPAESYRPRVEAFLKTVGATFPNYLSETASDELFETIGIESIPAVLVFDASGKLVRTFADVGEDAGFTYADNILPFVKQLLAK